MEDVFWVCNCIRPNSIPEWCTPVGSIDFTIPWAPPRIAIVNWHVFLWVVEQDIGHCDTEAFGLHLIKMGKINSITMRSLGFRLSTGWNLSLGPCSALNFPTKKISMRLAHPFHSSKKTHKLPPIPRPSTSPDPGLSIPTSWCVVSWRTPPSWHNRVHVRST